MLDNQTSIAVSAEMNECLKLGNGEGHANVRYWVFLNFEPRLAASGLAQLGCRFA